MKGFRIGWIGLAMAALMVCSAAATTDRAPAINASLLPFQLELTTEAPHESVTLSVSGPGNFFFRQTFAAGETMSFPVAQDGEPLADGLYTWEAVVNPALGPGVVRAMAEARATQDDGAADRLREGGQLPADSLLESGHFRISQGSIVMDQGPEPRPGADAPNGGMTRVPTPTTRLAAADQVIPDDLIVQSSLCVGFDCVNGESFGFDTIRLKENNLRIKFQDTSNSASFPTRDWQLTANDTTNGGANKFSIDDIDGGRTPFTILANAPSNSLFVNANGKVGLGTSTPVVELQVVDGDSPTLRLEQNGSSGFTPQTWDIAGNETNFFVRDVTNGSQLPLRIKPGADSNSLFIAANNDVGMGTDNPDASLHVRGTDGGTSVHVQEASGTEAQRTLFNLENNGVSVFRTADTSADGSAWSFKTEGPSFRINKEGTGGEEVVIRDRLDGTGLATLVVNGSLQATNVTFTSSREKKTDFVDLDPQLVLNRLTSLPVREWSFKDDLNGIRHVGPIAEDFHREFALGGATDSLSIIDLSGATLAGLQALTSRVEELQQENSTLRGEVELLRQAVEQLLSAKN